MSKHMHHDDDDDLRPEYDLSQLKGGVRGKYYRRAMSGTNLVLVEPDLAEACPDTESVSRGLLKELFGRALPVKRVEWLQVATHCAGPLLAERHAEILPATG